MYGSFPGLPPDPPGTASSHLKTISKNGQLYSSVRITELFFQFKDTSHTSHSEANAADAAPKRAVHKLANATIRAATLCEMCDSSANVLWPASGNLQARKLCHNFATLIWTHGRNNDFRGNQKRELSGGMGREDRCQGLAVSHRFQVKRSSKGPLGIQGGDEKRRGAIKSYLCSL